MNKFLCAFVKITGWLPFLLLNNPKYYYEDEEVQNRKIAGSAILMPNHHSVWDFAIMMYAFPKRILRCLVSEEIYKKGTVMTKLMNGLGSVRVDRDKGDFTFIEKSCEILDNGGIVEIYPEARLPLKNEKTPLEFKPSIAYIALESKAKIVPVVTNGCFMKKERLRVMIGKPIDISLLYEDGADEKQKIDMITKGLRQRIVELMNKLEVKTYEEKKD